MWRSSEFWMVVLLAIGVCGLACSNNQGGGTVPTDTNATVEVNVCLPFFP